MSQRIGGWGTTGSSRWAEWLSAKVPRGGRAVAWIGILFGIGAAWVALPPVTARSVVWPAIVGTIAILLGIGAISRGVKRVGWGAIVAGILGIGLGYLATRSGLGKLETVVVWSALFGAMLRYATPLIFASIGGMFSERSGVVNIGLEGMMLTGAFFGIWGADRFGQWWIGLIVAGLAGGLLALLHAFFCIHLRSDQIVTGTAVNFLALGITGYLFIDLYGGQGTPSEVPQIPTVDIGFIQDWYFIGPVFGQLNLMIWLAFLTVFLSWIVVFKTPIGLRIRAVGEHPRAADTVGLSVYGIRYASVVVSGILAALGGAYLSIGFVNSFNQNMTAGRGFIALAVLIVGNWRPFGAMAAALLFGFSSALADRLPTYSDTVDELFRALPYAITLIAVAGIIGRSIPPAAVGRPYKKQ